MTDVGVAVRAGGAELHDGAVLDYGTPATDAVYRAALRAAMRDGILTRREELHLAEVAEGLGIGARRALEIRGEVEQEAE